MSLQMTKQVCEDFFNFDGKFNQSHDIVSSLYHLIHSRKEKDYTHFKFLEKSINRQARFMNTKEEFSYLVNMALTNVDDGYDGEDVCWGLVAQLFYVSERIDTIAQRTLDKDDYTSFKRDMVRDLTFKLDDLFGDALTERRWKIFNLSTTLNKVVDNKNSFHFSDFAVGVLTMFIINKFL